MVALGAGYNTRRVKPESSPALKRPLHLVGPNHKLESIKDIHNKVVNNMGSVAAPVWASLHTKLKQAWKYPDAK